MKCDVRVQSPKINYTKAEVEAFVVKRRILPDVTLRKIKDRLKLFELTSKEELGNAFLISVFSELGPHPSRQRDEMVQEFLISTFQHYQLQFEAIVQKQQPGEKLLVPNMFGLSNLGFVPDAYKNIHWDVTQSQKLLNAMKETFAKPMGFDLVGANRLLLQMIYVHSRLRHDKKMSLQDLKKASDDYFEAEQRGHVFIPVMGEWSTTNILAQWHLKATVNRLPETLDGTVGVRGGLSAISAITHDHSHYVELRLRMTFTDAKAKYFIERALEKHYTLNQLDRDSSLLSLVIFVFVHNQEPLRRFATLGPKDPVEFANLLYNIVLNDSVNYSWFKTQYTPEEFKTTAQYWVRLMNLYLQ